ncbi:MAG: 30S ribosomal protein S18 [Bacteroidetes bacterium QS_1_65_9]|jgi:small subunit ribosomal protein S18|nr:MAG: 30S ribosomal protein S18 [Bacteroidetes bacterium QS_8_68_15]PSQ84601.1 MAG: 30S ribosomal protein S18 [Bacteroidetes bacterium QS_1_65_9]
MPRGADRSEYQSREYVDFRDVEFIQQHLNSQGKLLPRRVTGAPSRIQRQLSKAVKRARHMALLPYVTDSMR